MARTVTQHTGLEGLSSSEVLLLQAKFGKNEFQATASRGFFPIVWDIIKEPMFILLVIACSLYFILGQISEGIMMLVAMSIVTAISLFQEVKSSNALKALQQYAAPGVKVIRDGKEILLPAAELVPGDILLLEEGMTVPADALVLSSNDLSVNESIITGESMPATKNETESNNQLYQGTTINGGKCTARVTATGNQTVLGKLGKAVGAYHPPKTLLQQQINRFVRRLALFGLIAFFIIFLVNFLHYREWIPSLLFALTLAMSAVPEEIPVAFSSFMALGAFKMSRLGIISRQPQIVENLGAVSVICLDKTGTITENKMQVKLVYDHKSDKLFIEGEQKEAPGNVLLYAMLASETNPFDAMEQAIGEAFRANPATAGVTVPAMIHEYPLEGQPPMMTHVYLLENKPVAAAKGAAERIARVCHLTAAENEKINGYSREFASKGYRVIAVASAVLDKPEYPALQDDFNWSFEGLLALYDPPKKNIARVLQHFYNAGIDVKLVTGDYPETAMAIAGQVGLKGNSRWLSGEQVMSMSKTELEDSAGDIHLFARMFPDAKSKLIDALKAKGEIVAMTGDGVNDGPALKSAHVGIAMGKKGTGIARQASDLVLTDDNLDRMVTAIREGRKIFSNLKKAVRYIISIHIPIILTASIPVVLGWTYPNIFTPIHVIFLELIMGPTCSIFFEREPVEETIMLQSPRLRKTGLFTRGEMMISVLQGLVISAGVLLLYYYFMSHNHTIEQTRTIVFTTLICSNVFLTFANRSFSKSIFHTSRYRNNLAPLILVISVLFLCALFFIPAFSRFFQLGPVTGRQFLVCLGVAFVSVMWFELYKWMRVKRN